MLLLVLFGFSVWPCLPLYSTSRYQLPCLLYLIGPYGQPEAWYFPFTKKYWCPESTSSKDDDETAQCDGVYCMCTKRGIKMGIYREEEKQMLMEHREHQLDRMSRKRHKQNNNCRTKVICQELKRTVLDLSWQSGIAFSGSHAFWKRPRQPETKHHHRRTHEGMLTEERDGTWRVYIWISSITFFPLLNKFICSSRNLVRKKLLSIICPWTSMKIRFFHSWAITELEKPRPCEQTCWFSK